MNADEWDARYAAKEVVWSLGPNQFVEHHLADVRPGRAVDLAAGEGRNAIWLATMGWQVTAIDFSRVAIDKARLLAERVGVEVDLVCEDALRWEPDDPQDLVLLSYLQLPVDDQVAVLRRAAAWLAPGGTLFVIAHDRSNVEHGHGGPPSPDVCYDVDRTVAALGDLDVVEAEVVERVVETDDGTKIALDTLVLAQRPLSPDGGRAARSA